MKVMKITTEKTTGVFREPRYHFVYHWDRPSPITGKMSSRSIGTWASKSGALRAARRNVGDSPSAIGASVEV